MKKEDYIQIYKSLRDSFQQQDISLLQLRMSKFLNDLRDQKKIGFYFKKQDEEHLKIFFHEVSPTQCILRYEYSDIDRAGTPKWRKFTAFLEKEKIYSIIIEKEAVLPDLKAYLSGNKEKIPTGFRFNEIILRDTSNCIKFFSNFMSLFALEKKSLEFLNSLREQQLAIHPAFQNSNKELENLIKVIFISCTKITFVIYYPPAKDNSEITKGPEGIYLFFDDEKDMENKKLYKRDITFFENFKNNPFLSNGERLNSLRFCEGITPKQILYFVAQFRNKKSLSKEHIPNLIINPLRFNIVDEIEFLQKHLQHIEKSVYELDHLKIEYHKLREKSKEQEEEIKLQKIKNEDLNNKIKTLSKQKSFRQNEQTTNELSFKRVEFLARKFNLTMEKVLKLFPEEKIREALQRNDNSIYQLVNQEPEIAINIFNDILDHGRSTENLRRIKNIAPEKRFHAEKKWMNSLKKKFFTSELNENYRIQDMVIQSDFPNSSNSCPIVYSLYNYTWLICLLESDTGGAEAFYDILEVKKFLDRIIDLSPDQIVRKLNMNILQKRKKKNFPLFSIFVALLDFVNHKLIYSRAGSPYLYLNVSKNKKVETPTRAGRFLKELGYPKLGFCDIQETLVSVINIDPQDIIIWQTNSSVQFCSLYEIEKNWNHQILSNKEFLLQKIINQNLFKPSNKDLLFFSLERLK